MWEFEGDPDPARKLFIVANREVKINERGYVRCFKPTSNAEYYEANEARLRSVVVYQAGELPFFPDVTFIPADTYDVKCGTILSNFHDGTFAHKGEMPSDFPERMMNAVEKRTDWQSKKRKEFLAWFSRGV